MSTQTSPLNNPMELYAAATTYVAAGISVIPIIPDGSKKPAWRLLPAAPRPDGTYHHPWKPYQSHLPTPEELVVWFRGFGAYCGIAAIAGAVSGQLEILDFDSYDHVEPWMDSVRSQNATLLDRLVMVQTPRPGLHVYYRCPAVASNQKLAQRIVWNPESNADEPFTLIETRGEGGYALIPPTPPRCHPMGRPYIYASPHDLTSVPTISTEDRIVLIEAAKQFNEVPLSQARPAATSHTVTRVLDASKPGDDFELRADWTNLLERHDWSYLTADAAGVQQWCRPGKSGATSATLNYAGLNLLHVFSSNVSGLEPGKSYTKLAFLVAVEFDGDFAAAIAFLRRQGYGTQARSSWSTRRHQFLPNRRHSSR